MSHVNESIIREEGKKKKKEKKMYIPSTIVTIRTVHDL